MNRSIVVIDEVDYDLIDNEGLPKKESSPRRYWMAFTMHVSVAIIYLIRCHLSVAIVHMKDVFEWSPDDQSWILSSFFIGYMGGMLPMISIAERIGAMTTFNLGIMVTSILTLLVPLVSSPNYSYLVALRILTGFCQASAYPCMHSLLQQWSPQCDRSFMTAASWAGSSTGSIIAFYATGPIVAWNWPAVFYGVGGLGICWSMALYFIGITDLPQSCTWITPEEAAEISRLLHTEQSVEKANMNIMDFPWLDFFSTASVYAIFVGHFATNWIFYTLLTELPTYYSQEFQLGEGNGSIYLALPYIVLMVFTPVLGRVWDTLIRRGTRPVVVRRSSMALGLMVSGALLLVQVMVPMSETLVIVLITAAVTVYGNTSSGYGPNVFEVGPPGGAGIFYAVSNTIGTIPGIISPRICGHIITEYGADTHGAWKVIYGINFGVSIASTLFYIMFASSEKIKIKLSKPSIESF